MSRMANSDNAAAMLKKASELAKKAEGLTGGTGRRPRAGRRASRALPSKLVVTVSKKQLDDIGGGQNDV